MPTALTTGANRLGIIWSLLLDSPQYRIGDCKTALTGGLDSLRNRPQRCAHAYYRG